ncbi:MAG: radical SAM protein [Clostridia bacterium]|nr:radical SAM protein [Clostridia bacterium]
MNLRECNICPRNCKIDRTKGNIGYCKCDDKIKIALASIHHYEEPCISGQNGSGTVFFSNCNLRCIYCQNYEISQQGKGKEITIEQLAKIFLKQQAKGVHNINLVTPTMYAKQIKEALIISKSEGLFIPVIYNTNGYENVQTLQELEGLIDIYLPDLKYYSEELGKKYSKVDGYFEVATKAIQEMNRQVGQPVFNKNGIIQKGMIIRHLVLPNHLQNTKHILKWIKENMPEGSYISVMAQYFPTYQAKKDESMNRKLTLKEYREIESYLYTLNLQNGYMQELGEHEEEYVPKFDLSIEN